MLIPKPAKAINVALAGLIVGSFLVPKPVKAIGVGGFFIDIPNCSLKVYRKPTGPIDTLYAKTNFAGKWVIETENFIPPAQTGETLYVQGGWNLGKNAKTMWIRGAPGKNDVYDLYLDKFTVNLKDVIDTSNVNAPLNAIYNIGGLAPETTQIDTGINQGFTFYYDVHVPFDNTAAIPGRQGNIRLEKVVADTTWLTRIPFTVDTTLFDAQYLGDTVYFPLEKIVNDLTPPSISNVTEWPDTNYQGPYLISAEIWDASGIDTSKTKLSWKLNNADSSIASIDSIVSNNYYFTIDTTASLGDSVFYKLKAVDASANQNEAHWPAQGWYGFYVNDIVGAEEQVEKDLEFKVWPIIVKNKLYVKGANKFSVFDIVGGKVANYKANSTGAYDFNVPSGIYFVKSEDKIKKIIKLK